MKNLCLFLIINIVGNITAFSQAFVPNYDEAKIPSYTLPNVVAFEDGSVIKNVADWEKRRVEILDIFSKKVYGVSPDWDGEITATEVSSAKETIFFGRK
jgi:hypothetical protein